MERHIPGSRKAGMAHAGHERMGRPRRYVPRRKYYARDMTMPDVRISEMQSHVCNGSGNQLCSKCVIMFEYGYH